MISRAFKAGLVITKRTFGSQQGSPLLRTLFEECVKKRRNPCFELHSSQIQILKEPIDYYLALNVLCCQFYRKEYYRQRNVFV